VSSGPGDGGGECTDYTTAFDGATMTSVSFFDETDGSFEPYEFTNEVTSTVSGDQITISGDFIDFFSVDLTATMSPSTDDPSIGEVVFTEEDLGEASDGYIYRLSANENGQYDTCAGQMTLDFNVEYSDGADGWIFFYSTEAILTIN
jgi:hypothetical protein